MAEKTEDAGSEACVTNSDYAVICSFFEHFGDKSGLLFPSFLDLQQMIENTNEAAYPLVELHVKLMRKLKKTVNFDRWEKAAVKFAQSYSDLDGFEIERLGYIKVDLSIKLRLLKNLLEAQFDGNIKFKNEINKVTSDELRMQPLGKDLLGRRYWHLLDDDCNLRVYREDLDEETWELVSSDKESMLKLIEHLNTGKEYTEEEETSPGTSEESNTNSQEAFVKSESEVQTSLGVPGEAKRLKTEHEPIPSAEASNEDPIVGEAIESPVLLVQGQGNGADCDTGNPGGGNGEENCQSEKSDKVDGPTECNDNMEARLKPAVSLSELPDALVPAFESSTTAEEKAQLRSSVPIQENWKETLPILDATEKPSQSLVVETTDTRTKSTNKIESEIVKADLKAMKTNDAHKFDIQPIVGNLLSDCATSDTQESQITLPVPIEPSPTSTIVPTDISTNENQNVQSSATPIKVSSSFSLVAAYSGDESSDSDSTSKLCIDTSSTTDENKAQTAHVESLPETSQTQSDESQSVANIKNPDSGDLKLASSSLEKANLQTKSNELPLLAQTESPAQEKEVHPKEDEEETDSAPTIPIAVFNAETHPIPNTDADSNFALKEEKNTTPPSPSCPPIKKAENLNASELDSADTVAENLTDRKEVASVLIKSSAVALNPNESLLDVEAGVPNIETSEDKISKPAVNQDDRPAEELQKTNISHAKNRGSTEAEKPLSVLQVSVLTEESQVSVSPVEAKEVLESTNISHVPSSYQTVLNSTKQEENSFPVPEDSEASSEPELVMALETRDFSPDARINHENMPVESNIQSPLDPKEEVATSPNKSSPIEEKAPSQAIEIKPESHTQSVLTEVKAEISTATILKEETQQTSEKTTDLTKLTFDYDSSAPPSIILPPRSKATATESSAKNRRGRKRTKGGDDVDNADIGSEPVVLRQSSRIAKLREKEEEDRRKQEADRLQRLKEEHERREKRRNERDERMKKMEEKQQRRQLKTTVPREDDDPFEDEEDSEEEDLSSDDQGRKKKGKKRRKREKKKKDRPWDSSESSEKSSESEEDGLDELHAPEENEELVFKSDHEFSPESDLDDEDALPVIKHARTARAGTIQKKRGRRSKKVKAEIVEEEVEEPEEEGSEVEDSEVEEFSCQKCGLSDHPEWILLCDRCDGGWHANCVRPALMVIPEGEWFCPPCDHVNLVERLQERLEAFEFLRIEKEAELKRKKEEIEARLAQEEEEKRARELEEEEEQEEDDEEEGNSGIEEKMEIGAEDIEEEETSEEESGENEEEDDGDQETDRKEVKEKKKSNRNGNDGGFNVRKPRRAAKKANYSFKEYDDMIKSALRDEDEEEETAVVDDAGGKGSGKGSDGIGGYGKGPRDDEDEEEAPRSPKNRPAGVGNKRISTSDDEDSDIVPRVIQKKKSRKLNDLSATSNEDDSDEEFDLSSADPSDSEEDDEEASDSGDSFVVEDDSDSDVVDVSVKRKARAASPTIRRSTRNSRRSYNKKRDISDTSEEDESEFETVSSKRKRGNDSWDSSGESSSDQSWGRSKKRNSKGGGRSRPAPPPKPKAKPKTKPKPAARRTVANRGRGRGSRAGKADSEDEPFRSSVSVKKIKQAQPAVEIKEDGDSDTGQRRTTRGRQINYKELIDSSGDSQDEGNALKGMGTLFAADRGLLPKGTNRKGRGGATVGGTAAVIARADAVAVSGRNGGTEPVPVSVISSRLPPVQDDSSRSSDLVEAVTDASRTKTHIVQPSSAPDAAPLPTALPRVSKEAGPPINDSIVPPPVTTSSTLPADLQVSRLVHRSAEVSSPSLPPDMQVNRLINSSQSLANNAGSPVRRLDSPGVMPQQRLLRDALDSQTPSPGAQLILPTQASGSPAAPSPAPELPTYSSVIKQTRHSMPPIPPLYPTPPSVSTKPGDLSMPPITSSSVIRPYPTTATAAPPPPSSSMNSVNNPLSIQGLLAGQPSHPPPPMPPSHVRPFGNTSHMIGHGPFLNHPPYQSPYGVPVSHGSSSGTPNAGGYMGTPVTPTPRPAYPSIYPPPPHVPPHGIPLHSPYPPPQQHHGPPLRPTSSYQHAGFPQAFAAAAAAAAAANAVEEERRIFRVTQPNREPVEATYEAASPGGILVKGGVDELPPTGLPAESEFGGLVSYFSSQQEDFGES